MYQSLTETAQEVKTQPAEITPTQTRKTVYVPTRWTRTPLYIVPDWIYRMSDEQCLEALQKVKRLKTFPGTMYTSVSEAANFFLGNANYESSIRALLNANFKSREFPEDFPKKKAHELIRLCQDSVKNKSLLHVTMVTERARDVHYICYGEDPSQAIKIGQRGTGCKIISVRGMIIIAHRMLCGENYKTNGPAENVIDNCEISGYITRESFELIEEPVAENKPAPDPEPTPASVPKLDPTQTLTQMFQAMLTLLTKESEERGAEKLIQKLKEEGKL